MQPLCLVCPRCPARGQGQPSVPVRAGHWLPSHFPSPGLGLTSPSRGRGNMASSLLPGSSSRGPPPGPTPKVQYGAQPPRLPLPPCCDLCVRVAVCPLCQPVLTPSRHRPPGDRVLRAIIPPPAPAQEGSPPHQLPMAPTATSRVYYKNKRTERSVDVGCPALWETMGVGGGSWEGWGGGAWGKTVNARNE